MDERDHWQQVEALFDAAWEQPPALRGDWLRAQLAPPEVLAGVAALLASADASGDFLETTVTTGPLATDGRSAGQPLQPLLEPGSRAGAWRVVHVVGRGGMGEVYEVARDDGQFAQRGALKLITAADAAAWSRFQSERQILATLEHPGIARLIDGGLLASDRPYMVMEYVDGEPIDVHADRVGLSLRARVAAIREVGEALAHAHARLVVHSDLKPSNILIDSAGRPRLIDFGIAHLVDGGRDGSAQAMLSPDYAAPEQILGQPVSTATDVHGLAAVLYRLVAGVAVRRTAGLPTAVAAARIASTAPPAVSQAGAAARWRGTAGDRSMLADLDAILARALAIDSRHRYASVEAFCADLDRALNRQPVLARRDERGYRLGRWLQRNRWSAVALTAVVASLAIGLGAALWQGAEAARQRDEALRERARLEAIQQAVFHMFRSAGETRGSDATASQVLDSAAQRIQDEFARDPAAGAPTLHALGELYFLLNDYEAAVPLLRRLVESTDTPVDPEVIASARFDLAQAALRQGDAAGSRQTLMQAQAFWRSDTARWYPRLLESRSLEAQLLRHDGDIDEAIALLRQSLLERMALSGIHDRETGVLHNNLGVMLFGNGQFDEARAALAAARDVWRERGLEQSPDALNTLNNWAALEVTAGHPADAEPLFAEAVALRRRNFGPSAATAALLSNYGKLLVTLERPREAIGVLEEAVDMGQRYAGAGSVLHVAALTGLAESRLVDGLVLAAERDATSARQIAVDHLGATHPSVAATSIVLARVRGEQVRLDDAVRLLDEAQDIADASGVAGRRLSGQIAQVRQRYRLSDRSPAPGTATPLP